MSQLLASRRNRLLRSSAFAGVAVTALGLGGLPAASPDAANAAALVVDKPRIVPWHIIGDVGIGYSRARVEQVYGAEEMVPVTRGVYYDGGDGSIEVAYSADWNQRATVTVIRTQSARYRTADGLGVGSRVPFRRTWKGFTRYINPETGYFLYRYVAYGGRPLTVVLHVVRGAVYSISIYRGRADVAKVTLPGDPYYRKGSLPVPVVPTKRAAAPGIVLPDNWAHDPTSFAARPRSISLGTSRWFDALRWSAWGAGRAVGRGLEHTTDCGSCPELPGSPAPVTLIATQPGRCAGRLYYLAIRIEHSNGKVESMRVRAVGKGCAPT